MPQGLEATDLPADSIEVGRIADAWGVKGWFKVVPYSPEPEALFSSKRWFLMPPDRGVQTFAGAAKLSIIQAKTHADGVVASARDIEDRSHAEMLRGARVFVPRSSFPTPIPGEYYWVDLIGLSVVNREGVHLGRVQELRSTGPQTIMVLAEASEDVVKERMIPFVTFYVDDVDVKAGRILVDWQPDY